MARRFQFSMALNAAKTESIYQGCARYILVETDHGLKLQLPAVNFRGYVRSHGIHGRFEVSIDDNNRLLQLRQLQA